MKNPRHLLKHARYLAEAIPAYAFFGLCKILPLDAASALGGWLGRTIGPWMGVTRRAERNLARAMPELSKERRKEVICGMWDNLGRVGAEYMHLDDLFRLNRIEGSGLDIVKAMINDGKPGIIVGAHLANWEVAPLAAEQVGLSLATIYRRPNNPYVARLIAYARRSTSSISAPKGAEGVITLLRHMRNGGHIGLLIDQKLNEGISVPFFGLEARTTPAHAELALRHACPLAVARVERLKGAHFRMTLQPPLDLPATGDRARDVEILTRQTTKILEDWIREKPEQWLWLHNRWVE